MHSQDVVSYLQIETGGTTSDLLLRSWHQCNADPGEDRKNNKPVSPMNTNPKTFNKMLTNKIQSYIKKMLYYGQDGCTPDMEGCLDTLSH